MSLTIISFGYLHGEPPAADITQDMRPYRDPHVNPEMRQLTGRDQDVILTVLNTPGVMDVIADLVAKAGEPSGPRTIAVGCAGGRHRSVVVADIVTRSLQHMGRQVTVTHRDIDLPVVNR
ncbi:ATPase [Streptomyces sp. NPDC020983]|uniref:RapZ C-terminal domain-containing protein n=1 Tax=Streptomyces sp. NPDC020983 TaxID=3365106 RepID=UPI0037B29D3C